MFMELIHLKKKIPYSQTNRESCGRDAAELLLLLVSSVFGLSTFVEEGNSADGKESLCPDVDRRATARSTKWRRKSSKIPDLLLSNVFVGCLYRDKLTHCVQTHMRVHAAAASRAGLGN